jgi:hypothetical protein
MQDNNRYLNLLRSTELAKRKGEPFVPYDGYELEMFTKFTALEHLPALDNNGSSPEGWRLYATIPADSFKDLIENVKVYARDPSNNVFGIMVSSERQRFLIFIKQ